NHQVPDLAPPAPPKMNTMRIATPLGYSSRPPRKVWPIVLVAGLLLGLGGGAFAVAWFGKKGAPGASVADAVAAGSGAIAVMPMPPARDAAVAVPPTPDAVAAMATVVIDSTPQGAEVVGPDKKP